MIVKKKRIFYPLSLIFIIGLCFFLGGCQEEINWGLINANFEGCFYDTLNNFLLTIEDVEDNLFPAELWFEEGGERLSLTGDLTSGDTATLTIENWDYNPVTYTVTLYDRTPRLLQFVRDGDHPSAPQEMSFVEITCPEE